MMRIYIFLLLIFSLSQLKAQNCTCINDLEEVARAITKAPSFKDAVKEKGEVYFKNQLEKIKGEILKDPQAIKNCAGYLQKYLGFVRDKHLALNPDYANIKSPQDVLQTDFFKLTQARVIDTNRLNTTAEIEGIYLDVYKNFRVALVRDTGSSAQYLGIILSTKNGYWKPGQVKFILKTNDDGSYDGFFYDDIHFARYSNVRYNSKKLVGVEWVKEEQRKLEPVNPFLVPTKKRWDYQKLDETTDYVYLGTFSGMLAYESDTFYRELIPKLKGEKLIVDVRNNNGGGERSYNMFLNFLNSDACTAKQIAIIQNTKSASGGEHFILAMRKNPAVKTFGENSAGFMGYGYGNRSGITVKTTCFNYILNITENKYPGFKTYETVGIAPDVKLLRDKDWIKQVIAYLATRK